MQGQQVLGTSMIERGFFTLLLAGHAAAEGPGCEAWCSNPCAILNGNVEQECGTCTSAKYECRRGQPGFSWRERAKVVRPKPTHPAASMSGATPPSAGQMLLTAFDEQHGCRANYSSSACSAWDPDNLPAELDRGRNYCLHALCLGEMLSANGVAINAWDYVRAPSRFMAHEYFPLRLGAAELLVAMCAQLSTTHVLEGAACLAAAANRVWVMPSKISLRKRPQSAIARRSAASNETGYRYREGGGEADSVAGDLLSSLCP